MRPAKRWPAAISAAAVIGASMGLAAPALADVSEEATDKTSVEQVDQTAGDAAGALVTDEESDTAVADADDADGDGAESDEAEGAAGEEADVPADESGAEAVAAEDAVVL